MLTALKIVSALWAGVLALPAGAAAPVTAQPLVMTAADVGAPVVDVVLPGHNGPARVLREYSDGRRGAAVDQRGMLLVSGDGPVGLALAPEAKMEGTRTEQDQMPAAPARIPEPGNWALLLAGLAGVAAIVRRRSG
ncbi:MAG TPA: PEP-CTERM sorting domain-containing protein [Burkholderiales bacterium]|nr:PEP-CTERM sorting domain-containing protein [Burkholderiales bacterium]